MSNRADGDSAVEVAPIAFLFKVLLESQSIGDFQAVDNLAYSVEPYRYQEGGWNGAQRVFRGPASYGEVTLRWGMMNRDSLWRWARAVESGGDFRKNVQVLQLTRSRAVLRSYTLVGAWPIAWKGASLDASKSEIPVEEVQLAYQRLKLKVNSDVG